MSSAAVDSRCVRPRLQSGMTRPGSSWSPSVARPSGSWSQPCAARTSSLRSVWTSSTRRRSQMTLTGLVAELRREVVVGATVSERHTAAGQLARLARARVAGADPSTWWALTPLSDDRPLRGEGESAPVPPSRIESYGDCGLRWLLSTCGGDGPGVGAANIGTLIHDIAADLGDADEATMRAEVDLRWGRLGLPAGWLSRRARSEAQTMVARLARYFQESAAGGWERIGVELDMQVELGRAVLKGRVDRLERDGSGGLRVVDLKTGSGKPTRGDLLRNAQLGAYQAAVEHGAFADHGTVSAGAALLQVGTG